MKNTRKGLPIVRAHIGQIFPKLTPAQIRRITPHGHIRKTARGEVLYEQGTSAARFFIVFSGESRLFAPRAQLRPLLQSIDLASSLVRSARCQAGGPCSEVRVTKTGKVSSVKLELPCSTKIHQHMSHGLEQYSCLWHLLI